MRRSRKFCQRGSNSDKVVFVLFFRGARLQRSPKAGNYRPARETSFAGRPIWIRTCWTTISIWMDEWISDERLTFLAYINSNR